MIMWAEQQSNEGAYLEFADIFLLAEILKIKLKMFVYAEGQPIFLQISIVNFVQPL